MTLKSEIHAIYFDKSKFKTPKKALKWINKHKYDANLIEEKPNGWWINITPKQRYKKYTTEKIEDEGINLIFGWA